MKELLKLLKENKITVLVIGIIVAFGASVFLWADFGEVDVLGFAKFSGVLVLGVVVFRAAFALLGWGVEQLKDHVQKTFWNRVLSWLVDQIVKDSIIPSSLGVVFGLSAGVVTTPEIHNLISGTVPQVIEATMKDEFEKNGMREVHDNVSEIVSEVKKINEQLNMLEKSGILHTQDSPPPTTSTVAVTIRCCSPSDDKTVDGLRRCWNLRGMDEKKSDTDVREQECPMASGSTGHYLLPCGDECD